MKVRSGGGLTSNKLVTAKAGQKVEPRSRAIAPEAASSIGKAAAGYRPPLITQGGRGYQSEPMPPKGVGNATKRPDVPSPGSGRTIYRTGSQMQYGNPVQGSRSSAPDVPGTTPGKDILNDYGPNRRR